jgi:hypothetical protein
VCGIEEQSKEAVCLIDDAELSAYELVEIARGMVLVLRAFDENTLEVVVCEKRAGSSFASRSFASPLARLRRNQKGIKKWRCSG